MSGIQNIYIDGTAKTPQIDFNNHSGELILSGRSIPENAAKVYEPLLQWITEYIASPQPETNLRLNLEYFNSATSIWLAKIVKALSRIDVNDYVFFIHVYFDIEDFYNMDIEDFKDIIASLVDSIIDSKVSIGVKTYGVDSDGKIVKESTVLI